ncbi:hypothetical protein [Kitasatospora sp. NPDC097643]|uniref:hypothetical protein n=1 Tax=Kitasatospora sp. NPDC097643 TaxID=3157230 RepID=UPI00331ADCA6
MGEKNFVDDIRSKVNSPDGKDMQGLTDEVSRQVVDIIQANLPKILAMEAMKIPEKDGGLGYACTSTSFTCGTYSCTGIVSCSGDFNCTIQFAG